MAVHVFCLWHRGPPCHAPTCPPARRADNLEAIEHSILEVGGERRHIKGVARTDRHWHRWRWWRALGVIRAHLGVACRVAHRHGGRSRVKARQGRSLGRRRNALDAQIAPGASRQGVAGFLGGDLCVAIC